MSARGGALGAVLLCAAILASVAGEPAPDISVQDLSIAIVESGGAESTALQLAFPAKADRRLRLDHTQTLRVTYRVASRGGGEPVRPQQAFLRLTAPGGDAAYFASLKTKEGGLQATATPADVGMQGGGYAAALLVAGTNVGSPLEWELGSVELLHPPRDDGTQARHGAGRSGCPPDAPLRAGVGPLFEPQPEIRHAHRAPERRAPAAVSLVFTALAFFPLAAFLAALACLGCNAKGLPAGAGFIWVAGLHGGLAAILGLLLLFWLRLSLMQLLPLLGGLGAATALVGSKALARVDASRKKQD
eukprot:scaffold16.g48.t1